MTCYCRGSIAVAEKVKNKNQKNKNNETMRTITTKTTAKRRNKMSVGGWAKDRTKREKVCIQQLDGDEETKQTKKANEERKHLCVR